MVATLVISDTAQSALSGMLVDFVPAVLGKRSSMPRGWQTPTTASDAAGLRRGSTTIEQSCRDQQVEVPDSHRHTGCGAAWLARLTGGQEVPGSNPGSPTESAGSGG